MEPDKKSFFSGFIIHQAILDHCLFSSAMSSFSFIALQSQSLKKEDGTPQLYLNLCVFSCWEMMNIIGNGFFYWNVRS